MDILSITISTEAVLAACGSLAGIVGTSAVVAVKTIRDLKKVSTLLVENSNAMSEEMRMVSAVLELHTDAGILNCKSLRECGANGSTEESERIYRKAKELYRKTVNDKFGGERIEV